jgi:hypothetical protein
MDDAEARRLRARRLREEIARLREGEARGPSSPREFVEREGRRKEERTEGEEEEDGEDGEDGQPGGAPPD